MRVDGDTATAMKITTTTDCDDQYQLSIAFALVHPHTLLPAHTLLLYCYTHAFPSLNQYLERRRVT